MAERLCGKILLLLSLLLSSSSSSSYVLGRVEQDDSGFRLVQLQHLFVQVAVVVNAVQSCDGQDLVPVTSQITHGSVLQYDGFSDISENIANEKFTWRLR